MVTLENTRCLIASIMKAKYYPNRQVNKAILGNKPSFA
jgi:hypothetical protein